MQGVGFCVNYLLEFRCKMFEETGFCSKPKVRFGFYLTTLAQDWGGHVYLFIYILKKWLIKIFLSFIFHVLYSQLEGFSLYAWHFSCLVSFIFLIILLFSPFLYCKARIAHPFIVPGQCSQCLACSTVQSLMLRCCQVHLALDEERTNIFFL